MFELSQDRTSAMLVIATDGVWDVLSANQVVGLIDQHPASRQLYKELMQDKTSHSASVKDCSQALAKHVVDSAFDVKKNNDDVTAIVAGLSLNRKLKKTRTNSLTVSNLMKTSKEPLSDMNVQDPKDMKTDNEEPQEVPEILETNTDATSES